MTARAQPAPPPPPAPLAPASISPTLRFGELFVYGMISLLPGGGTLTFPDQRPPVCRPTKATRAPIGSMVSTSADETARLRLECGSHIDLGPDSCVVLRARHLELQKGPCTLRHVGSPFSLKVGGIATFSLRPESVLEVERVGDTVMVRVQAGRVKFPSLEKELIPGENAVATRNTAQGTTRNTAQGTTRNTAQGTTRNTAQGTSIVTVKRVSRGLPLRSQRSMEFSVTRDLSPDPTASGDDDPEWSEDPAGPGVVDGPAVDDPAATDPQTSPGRQLLIYEAPPADPSGEVGE